MCGRSGGWANERSFSLLNGWASVSEWVTALAQIPRSSACLPACLRATPAATRRANVPSRLHNETRECCLRPQSARRNCALLDQINPFQRPLPSSQPNHRQENTPSILIDAYARPPHTQAPAQNLFTLTLIWAIFFENVWSFIRKPNNY
jgi:hypothetical protein